MPLVDPTVSALRKFNRAALRAYRRTGDPAYLAERVKGEEKLASMPQPEAQSTIVPAGAKAGYENYMRRQYADTISRKRRLAMAMRKSPTYGAPPQDAEEDQGNVIYGTNNPAMAERVSLDAKAPLQRALDKLSGKKGSAKAFNVAMAEGATPAENAREKEMMDFLFADERSGKVPTPPAPKSESEREKEMMDFLFADERSGKVPKNAPRQMTPIEAATDVKGMLSPNAYAPKAYSAASLSDAVNVRGMFPPKNAPRQMTPIEAATDVKGMFSQNTPRAPRLASSSTLEGAANVSGMFPAKSIGAGSSRGPVTPAPVRDELGRAAPSLTADEAKKGYILIPKGGATPEGMEAVGVRSGYTLYAPPGAVYGATPSGQPQQSLEERRAAYQSRWQNYAAQASAPVARTAKPAAVQPAGPPKSAIDMSTPAILARAQQRYASRPAEYSMQDVQRSASQMQMNPEETQQLGMGIVPDRFASRFQTYQDILRRNMRQPTRRRL